MTKRALGLAFLGAGLLLAALIAYSGGAPPIRQAPTPALARIDPVSRQQMLGAGAGSQTLAPLGIAAAVYALQARLDAPPAAGCQAVITLTQPDGSRLPILRRAVAAGQTWVGTATLTIRATGVYTPRVESDCVWALQFLPPTHGTTVP